MPTLHSEALEILARLHTEKIDALYHFTDIHNLPLIFEEGGLLSKQRLEECGRWPPPKSGGNDLSHNLDIGKGNWDLISLSLTPHTPMAYWRKRETQLCFIVVKIEVATWKATLFTDTNAASNGHQKRDGISGLELIDFPMVRTVLPDNPKWKRGVQAEVLVQDLIPLAYVSQIVFPDEACLRKAQELCGKQSNVNFTISKIPFSDSPDTFQITQVPEVPHIIQQEAQVVDIPTVITAIIEPYKPKISESTNESLTEDTITIDLWWARTLGETGEDHLEKSSADNVSLVSGTSDQSETGLSTLSSSTLATSSTEPPATSFRFTTHQYGCVSSKIQLCCLPHDLL